jgi:hypothetical protein
VNGYRKTQHNNDKTTPSVVTIKVVDPARCTVKMNKLKKQFAV